MLLLKAPVPVPSLVVPSEVVGLVEVLQHTPRAVTDAPPSAEIFPPEEAVVDVIALMAVVVSVGTTADAVKFTSLP